MEDITSEKALELYKNALNFNVVNRYDPALRQLLYVASHCVVYRFDSESDEWIKTDYQGATALYLRDFKLPQKPAEMCTYADLQNLFCYGLIVLNRNKPECFSMGLLPNRLTGQFFPRGVAGSGVSSMDVEMNDNLLIVKNLLGEIYGLWVYSEAERLKIFKLLEFCLHNDSKQV